MGDRISWSNLTRLRDHDVFDVLESTGTAGQLRLTLATAPNITWWKAMKLMDRRSGSIVEQQEMQDADHGPRSLVVTDPQADSLKLVLAKAKIFGVHTDMYEIYELREKLGRDISLTWRADGPENIWGAIGSFISDVANGVVGAVQTVTVAVITAVESVVSVITDAIAWVAGLILAIPIIGRAIALIINAVMFAIGWVVNSLLEAGFAVAGVFGVRRPEKLLRLQVVIQRDALNNPVATIEQVRVQIDFLVKLFQERANIKVLPAGPFRFTSAFNASPPPAEDYITVLDRPSSNETLNVRCGEGGFLDDFGSAGAGFQVLMNNLFWGNTRRLLGTGAPLVAFAVDRFTDGRLGCSLGPTYAYVTVDFLSQYSMLAHEVTHASGLLHDADPANLMFSNPPSPMTSDGLTSAPGDLTKWLTEGQVTTLRNWPRAAFA